MPTYTDEILFKVKASPFFWRQKAAELKYAAELLKPSIDSWLKDLDKILINKEPLDVKTLETNIFSIYFALIGFSTECLFKGTIVRNNPALMSPSGGKSLTFR